MKRETLRLVGGSNDGQTADVLLGEPYIFRHRKMTTADAMAEYDREVGDFPQSVPDNREIYERETIYFGDGDRLDFMRLKGMTTKQALEHVFKRKP